MKYTHHSAFKALTISILLSNLAYAQESSTTGEEDGDNLSKKPNVLLIVDTSGSMEYVTESDSYPTCDWDSPNIEGDDSPANEKSRWIEVLEVLTGAITNYSCDAVDRSSSPFASEYSMPGNAGPPPDADYRNPYHRPLSGGCALTPSLAGTPLNAYEWAAPWGTPYPVDVGNGGSKCKFNQAGDGFIDTYNDQVRFGLMTFDTLPHAGTGHAANSPYGPAYADGPNSGILGAWSYFLPGQAAAGKPADCKDPHDVEVGVRNAAAPASEGKMIYFGGQNLGITKDQLRHERLQQVLLATRPFGATPLNGALSDARDFFWNDDSDEPTQSTGFYETTKLSPRFDEYVDCGCRKQHVILITDGEPNLDLRPECEAEVTLGAEYAGKCPYKETPEDILADLSGSKGRVSATTCTDSEAGKSKYSIVTHVIGFAKDTYENGNKDCAGLRTDIEDWNDEFGSACKLAGASDPDLKVCCTLHRLAAAGSEKGDGMPYLATTSAGLATELDKIMKTVSDSKTSSTRPVRSPGVGLADETAVAFRLLTSYQPPKSGGDGLWRGNIERMRWTCDDGVLKEEDFDDGAGDDFAFNVSEHLAAREFLSFLPSTQTAAIASGTLRPWVEGDPGDGLGTTGVGGSLIKAKGSGIASIGTPGVMGISNGEAKCDGDDAATCAKKILAWTMGVDGASENSRCADEADGAATKDCHVIGDIVHSTPVIVDRPGAAVEDESYKAFSDANNERAMMAYFSSNDGLLHGFNLSPNKVSADPEVVDDAGTNNEFFAFMPPAILPLLKSQYPGTRKKLLDGVAVVQDVVAIPKSGSDVYVLERSLSDVDGLASTWRTILVQAFGGEDPGFFALDITDPSRPSGSGGPKFLWQLTTTTAGDDLFGPGGTPLITTINLLGKETAVAVLPGGRGSTVDPSLPNTGPGCPRENTDLAKTHVSASLTKGLSSASESYTPRSRVNCYDNASLAARSLTIVRLDTGEIIRTFRRAFNSGSPEVGGLSSSVYSDTSTDDPFLDSPITGIPAAFPAGTGMVADRLFVGDQDGTLWRVDLSNTDPGKWEMKLFFDAYAESENNDVTKGKPIMTAPVLSVDERGLLTINFSTGDQDLSGGLGDNFFVYSLTEAEAADVSGAAGGVYSKLNWQQKLINGEHVLGPMSLLGGVLYFSTLAPAPTEQNACDPTDSNIWGVDYIKPQLSDPTDETEPPVQGGLARLSTQGTSGFSTPLQYEPVSSLVENGENTTIFGVSLEYTPSCDKPPSVAGTLIPGNRSKVTAPDSSPLQLVFQTNKPSKDMKFKTGFEAVTIAPPRTASRILSWAAILE